MGLVNDQEIDMQTLLEMVCLAINMAVVAHFLKVPGGYLTVRMHTRGSHRPGRFPHLAPCMFDALQEWVLF